jgi:hypothetical protein
MPLIKKIEEFIRYNPFYKKMLEGLLQTDPDAAKEIVDRARVISKRKLKARVPYGQK